ncbi:hypothetical protein BDQ12DRAFT_688163 [Crucibulum laeve]|uniref:FAD/NAD(P)-binding domain-containing protein n=1 Tax=Crucibulum laeve TaxID=68775 RepID=A0A5C3M311_9AGAR|nr:hypothetical protein BDQ12DRAFT_688163 [Crucibulum laeve]
MASPPSSKDEETTVAIIGAGTGGLALAIALKQKLGYHKFTIYEKASEVGGTWRDNIYPGCSSDIHMGFYSLSTDLRDWKESHGSQEVIFEYWKDLAKKYDIYPYISFDSKVVSANWDDMKQRYDLLLENSISGSRRQSTAHIVISAIGVLEVPRFASIPGLNDFKGQMFHSARWERGVDMRGKRVAVIGNGASATQFIPIISEDPSVEVIEFCRTPNWFMPPVRSPYSSLRRWAVRNVPFLMRFSRILLFLRFEGLYWSVFGTSIFRPILAKFMGMYIRYTAPKQYHRELTPNYPPGCKRIIFDTNYLAALHRPNLTLNWDGIESIVEAGILTKKGETIPFDIIILSTGFAADEFPIPITGNKSYTIQKYFESQGGGKAYLGTAYPAFPNFFTICGPNTATGHTSVIYSNEVQIDYIIQLIKPILSGDILSLEVRNEPTEEYNDKLQARLSKSVFTSCFSWYRVGGTGKITNIFPGSGTTFWWWLRKPNWDHYTGIGVEGWATSVREKQRRRQIVSFTLAAATGALIYHVSKEPSFIFGYKTILDMLKGIY